MPVMNPNAPRKKISQKSLDIMYSNEARAMKRIQRETSTKKTAAKKTAKKK